MPGIEVYTISGLGAAAATPVVRLQNALKTLGQTVGDAQLTSLVVDGVIGPKTVAATNYAFAKYVEISQKSSMSPAQIRAGAAALAARVEGRVEASGGTVGAPVVVRPKQRAGAPAPVFIPPPAPNRRWIFWAVGGVGVFVILAAAATAVKKRRQAVAA